MKKRIASLLCILLLCIAFPAFAIDIEGGWSGSVKLAGRKISVSTSFSGGGFSTSGSGYSLSGSYSVSGKRVKLHASGMSISLTFSDNGTRQKMSGSGTMRGVKWSLSLSRSSPEKEETEPTKKADANLSEGALYGEYTGTWNGRTILARLYESGYVFWRETATDEASGADTTTEYGAQAKIEALDRQAKSLQATLTLSIDETAPLPTFWSEAAPNAPATVTLDCALDASQAPMRLTCINAQNAAIVLTKTDTTLERLPAEDALLPLLTLARGDKGTAVAMLQEALIARSFLDGSADGVYGKLTKAAVTRFEEAQSLTPDGIADALVMRALFAQTNAAS